ncbi:MAG TPA: GNAT family N-acetyltransferase [Phycisphaerales bacterium]|nr:GNAT family N-acetyltransferase [Phycisphaerales bacterium]
MRVTVRRAGAIDAPRLAPLFDAYRRFYAQPSDLAGAEAFLRARLGAGESVVFIAEEGARALGFAQLYPTWTSVSLGPRWVLNDLFVAPEVRRGGVGRALIRACAAHCVASGAKGMALLTERTNDAARRLYESEGWELDEKYLRFTWKP